MISFPNAKINIGLSITQRRTDGFHDLESVFYPVSWCDALEMHHSESFEFKTDGLEISGDASSNLIVKAYHLLKPKIGDKEVKIHLLKAIPMGAGMGGGSADGAIALKMLNDLFDLNLAIDELKALAAKLGSDCPFFIENKAMFCYGRGTEMQRVALDLHKYQVVLVNPHLHVSTKDAYAMIQPKPAAFDLREIAELPIENWEGIVINDFESPMIERFEKIGQIKESLYKQGALYASMTGSGSTVYGIFDDLTHFKNEFENCTVHKGKFL